MKNTPLHKGVPPFLPSRRQFILGTAIAAAFGSASYLPFGKDTGTKSGLQSTLIPTAFAETAPAQDAGFAAFMKASSYLTGKTTLDNTLVQAIYAAMSEDDAHFAADLAVLNAFVDKSATPAIALQASLDASQSAVAALPKRIMQAWYRGIVGSGGHARAIAYEEALMYPPISDFVVMPTFARGVPGYWAKPFQPARS